MNIEGHKTVHFADDIFTHDAEWVTEVCSKIIERKIECEWVVNSRCDIQPINWHIFDLMKRAGCSYVMLGIESGNQRSLINSKKGLKIEKVIPLIERVREAGIKIRCNLMVGLPGSTYQNNLDSIELMKTILPDQITMSLCTPYPGTELDNRSEHYGIKFKTTNWTTKFQRDYISVALDEFKTLIEYEHISAEEIFHIPQILLADLKPYGYISESERGQRIERVIKTYLGKSKLKPFERKNTKALC